VTYRTGSGPAVPGPTTPHRVLVTGAAGTIGGFLRVRLRRPGRILRLTDVVPIGDGDEEIRYADLTDPAAVADLCTGVDAIVHLGGIGTEAPLEDLMRVNVTGTANVLDGARTAGVPRVVLASSSHAVGFYSRADVPPGGDGLPDGLSPRPDSYYGWSKAAGEALGALYHDRFGIGVIAVRIGTCTTRPTHMRGLSTWLSPDDAARLVEACLATPDPGFRVVWGISANTRRWWSLAGARRLGYRPRDDAEAFADGITDAEAPEEYVGGAFCRRPLGERW
jgi:nucleoside-diphosphate-sugar epimerase